jgi:hypothetical protein
MDNRLKNCMNGENQALSPNSKQPKAGRKEKNNTRDTKGGANEDSGPIYRR